MAKQQKLNFKKDIRIRVDEDKYDQIVLKMKHEGIEKVTYQNMFDYLARYYIENDELESGRNSKMLKLLNSLIEASINEVEESFSDRTIHLISELAINVGVLNEYLTNDILVGLSEK